MYAIIYREIRSHHLAENKNKNKNIFFLSGTPDGKAYGIKTAVHKLKLNGNAPASYKRDGNTYTVDASDERFSSSSNDFLQQVEEIANSKK